MINRRELLKYMGLSGIAAVVSSALAQSTNSTMASGATYELGELPMLSANKMLQLNFNENSLGMAPSARRAVLDSLDIGFRYPDDQRAQLITKIAAWHGIDEKNLSLGNGSSENIQAVVEMLANKARQEGKKFQVVMPEPTFDYAEIYAKAIDISVAKVQLKEDDFSFDLVGLQKVANDFDGISLFYLCNPNNPTATLTPSAQLRQWIKEAPANHYFLMDEAYAEYVTDPEFESAVQWVKQGLSENLIVTRTFSKLFALAGMRVGYAIGHADIIAACETFMAIDNTNLAGAVAAAATLDDKAFLAQSLDSNNRSRQITEAVLDELGLRYLPSHSNFIFHEIKGDVKTYQARMKENHILVGREFLPIQGYSRLTLGTPEEMTVFSEVLKSFRQKDWI